MSEAISVDVQTFDKVVLQSDIPVLVDFWAPWCGPCKMLGPILDHMAKEFAGKLIIAKVNTDENQAWAGKYGVQGIPTMLMMKDGKIVHRQVGVLPEPMLRDTIKNFLEVANSKS